MQEAIPTEKEKDCYSKNNNSNLDLLEIKNMRKSKNASGALYPDSIYPGICLENEYNNYCYEDLMEIQKRIKFIFI